ncbi:MAG: hypothetical protein ABUL60_23080 [Myxococcales bacterium]
MKKVGLAWGAAMMLAAAATPAAPKSGAQTANGAAGAGATPAGSAPATTPTGSAAGTTPTPTPSASSSALAPPAEAPPPTVDGVNGAPEAVPTPPAASAAQPDSAEDEEEEAEREAARKKRKRRRQRELEAAAEREEEESQAPSPPVTPPGKRWHLMGSHVLLSAERMSSVLSWSSTSGSSFERSGTDVSFLGSGGVTRNAFGVPRIALDGMFNSGLTLGGSLSYIVASGKNESTTGAIKNSMDEPTSSVFILAPRIGVMIPASPKVGVWLRGGITRISVSTDSPTFDPQTGAALTGSVTSTNTLVDLALDPQLVISPVPHVGIALGVALDIGLSGTSEVSGSSFTQDIKASSYGVTGGLVAIF